MRWWLSSRSRAPSSGVSTDHQRECVPVCVLQRVDTGGGSVTMPLKLAIVPFLASLTPAATTIGAVNAIVKAPDGSLVGDNTDWCAHMSVSAVMRVFVILRVRRRAPTGLACTHRSGQRCVVTPGGRWQGSVWLSLGLGARRLPWRTL